MFINFENKLNESRWTESSKNFVKRSVLYYIGCLKKFTSYYFDYYIDSQKKTEIKRPVYTQKWALQ